MDPMTHEARHHFHEELQRLERDIQAMGILARKSTERAINALVMEDVAECDLIIDDDDEIDRYYLDIEKGILDAFALQTPVAGDLRLLTALLHVNVHLERIGDIAVNVAKITKLAAGLTRIPQVVQHLEEMGGICLKMIEATMSSFADRDANLAAQLPKMDDPINRLNRGMAQHILEHADDKSLLEWGLRMQVVSRQLERVGDHAVDIGEQVAFLVTGEFREFTDASD